MASKRDRKSQALPDNPITLMNIPQGPRGLIGLEDLRPAPTPRLPMSELQQMDSDQIRGGISSSRVPGSSPYSGLSASFASEAVITNAAREAVDAARNLGPSAVSSAGQFFSSAQSLNPMFPLGRALYEQVEGEEAPPTPDLLGQPMQEWAAENTPEQTGLTGFGAAVGRGVGGSARYAVAPVPQLAVDVAGSLKKWWDTPADSPESEAAGIDAASSLAQAASILVAGPIGRSLIGRGMPAASRAARSVAQIPVEGLVGGGVSTAIESNLRDMSPEERNRFFVESVAGQAGIAGIQAAGGAFRNRRFDYAWRQLNARDRRSLTRQFGSPEAAAAAFDANPNAHPVLAKAEQIAVEGELIGARETQQAGLGRPERARAVLRGLDAPAPANTGMLAYHGTGARWAQEEDAPLGRPRLDKIGTGEGAQAYGWGLYFAEDPGVAGHYREALTGSEATFDGLKLNDFPFPSPERSALGAMEWADGDIKRAIEALGNDFKATSFLKLHGDEINVTKNPGSLYTVDIPDAVVDGMLDWDKQVPNGQLAKIRDEFERSGIIDSILSNVRESDYIDDPSTPKVERDKIINEIRNELRSRIETRLSGIQNRIGDRMTGSDLYRWIGNTLASTRKGEYLNNSQQQKLASDLLFSLGIPGIKFLDATSRSRGEGKRNLVLFDESLARVVARNDESVPEPYRSRYADEIASRGEPIPPPLRRPEPPRASSEGGSIRMPGSRRPRDMKADESGGIVIPPRQRQQIPPSPQTGIGVLPETFFDRAYTAVRDRFYPVVRYERAVEKAGGTPQDVAIAETLMAGRVKDRIRRFEENEARPLETKMKTSGVDPADVDLFLMARAARERNRLIESRNQSQDGSGISDAKATRIMRDFASRGMMRKLKDVVADVDAINERRVNLLVAENLLSPQEAAQWRANHKLYAPLRTEFENVPPNTGGKGVRVQGKESRRAEGRTTVADSPLAFTYALMNEAIVRSERNRVATRMADMVDQNPDRSLWRVQKVDKDNPLPFGNRNVVPFKRNGEQYYMEFNDPRLARALQYLNDDQSSRIVKGLGKINRFLSMTRTQADPEFILTNLARDLQTAGINITSVDGLKMATSVLADVIPAQMAAIRALRGGSGTDRLSVYFDEFRKEGGPTSFMDVKTASEYADQINQNVSTGRRPMGSTIREAMQLISDMNESVENAVRLAYYAALRDNGTTPERAAFAAKELTVNFNKRGEIQPVMGSLYLFWNATVQGQTRVLEALNTRTGKALAAGIAASAASLVPLNRLMAGEDENGENYYDQITEDEKTRNWIFMVPGGQGNAIKIPLPYGYNVFNNIGRTAAEAASGRMSPGQAASSIMGSFVDAFNPFGSISFDEPEKGLTQMVMPTLGDPVADIALNYNFAGRPIMPQPMPYGPEKPDSEMYFQSARQPSVAVARWLNSVTGGSAVREGTISVSPESIDHLYDFVAGGTGRFPARSYDVADRLINGKEIPVNNIPFIRRFVGEPSEYHQMQNYQRNRREVGVVSSEFKQIMASDMSPEEKVASIRELNQRTGNVLTRTRAHMTEDTRRSIYGTDRLDGDLDIIEKALEIWRDREDAAKTDEEVERARKQIENLQAKYNSIVRQQMGRNQ